MMSVLTRRHQVLVSSIVLTLFLLVAACNPDEPRTGVSGAAAPAVVSLRTDATRYSPGDKPKLTLSNQTEGAVAYNLCVLNIDLERNDAGTWKQVPTRLGPGGCTDIGYQLRPGGSANGEVNLPADLPSGTYRFSHVVGIEGVRQPIATDAFQVGH